MTVAVGGFDPAKTEEYRLMKIHAGPVLELSLYAEDLEAAERFYETVMGLEVTSRFDDAVAFRCGEQVLLVFDPARSSASGRRVPPHGVAGAAGGAGATRSADTARGERAADAAGAARAGRAPGAAVPGPTASAAGAGHVAFATDQADLAAWRSHLDRHGVEVEAEVTWPTGRSLYFRDPAGNLIELAPPDLWGPPA